MVKGKRSVRFNIEDLTLDQMYYLIDSLDSYNRQITDPAGKAGCKVLIDVLGSMIEDDAV